MWYEWIFSGIGTTILSGIVGVIIGGLGGYQIGMHNKGKQQQKAGDDAKQQQEFRLQCKSVNEKSKIRNTVKQMQSAGDRAEQTQVGGIRNGK